MQVLQIDMATLGWLLFAAAAGSSLLTLILLGIIGHFWLAPRVERKIDRRLEEVAAAFSGSADRPLAGRYP